MVKLSNFSLNRYMLSTLKIKLYSLLGLLILQYNLGWQIILTTGSSSVPRGGAWRGLNTPLHFFQTQRLSNIIIRQTILLFHLWFVSKIKLKLGFFCTYYDPPGLKISWYAHDYIEYIHISPISKNCKSY